MLAQLLINTDLRTRKERINQILTKANLTNPHADLLYFAADEKLGVEQAKKIREHLAFKPLVAPGKVVVLEDAGKLTIDAQNSLLKTLEEPPAEALLVLGATKVSDLLPTIQSRCEIINLEPQVQNSSNQFNQDIENLARLTTQERFIYIEKLGEKEEFLEALVKFYREQMADNPKLVHFNKQLIKAEEWANQNVNIRAILEYLMFRLPPS